MQAGVGLLVSDVMPIYMIIPRYSHNYAQFCHLLNSNAFTHRKILMLLREATSETYGPRVVGGNRPPRTPMGTKPLIGSVGAEVARRADRGEAHEGFTQLRVARMRKTLLLLCGLYCVESARCYSTLELLASLDVNGCPPSPTCAWGLLL